ncbi:MAG: 50S ribosomal protein L18e [Thermoplasmata archaeon]|nr:50S ribosomal protein L18e [Thermoplasmata archaeon]
MKINKKTNPNTTSLILELKKVSRDNDAAIWRDIARRLEKPSSRWSEVNLSEIDRHAKDKDTIVIPGKLLGSGNITKAVNVAAFRASESAKKKLESAGGKLMKIEELAASNPKGSGVRIMG